MDWNSLYLNRIGAHFIIFIWMIRPTITYSNLCFLTMLIFAIADLWFAYNDYSCTLLIPNLKLGFGLGTWLKVSGYTNLIFLLVPIIGFFLGSLGRPLMIAYMVFALFYTFFRFVWVVIGAIIFWGYLSNPPLCTSSLHTYMWINLIYSIFVLLAMCYNHQQVYTTSFVTTRSGYAV